MTEKCEPPPELRDRDGEHHIYCHPAGTDVRGNPVVVRWGARAQGWWADHLDLRGHNAAEAASMGWRYHSPVTPPAVVAALVEALEAAQEALTITADATGYGVPSTSKKVAEALAAYREAAR